jgi:hypothetical protein
MDLKTIAKKYKKDIMTVWRNFKKFEPHKADIATNFKNLTSYIKTKLLTKALFLYNIS